MMTKLGTLLITTLIAMPLVVAPAIAKESRHGDFTFVQSQDSFDDSDRSFILTPSENSDREAALSWKCMSDGLNVVYLHNKYLAGDADDDIVVRYRIDGNVASEPEYWRLLQGNEASFIPMHRIPAFTREARAGIKIRFEAVDPLDGERLTDVFSLKGLSEALRKLPCYNER